jgi:hypothetical protein
MTKIPDNLRNLAKKYDPVVIRDFKRESYLIGIGPQYFITWPIEAPITDELEELIVLLTTFS